MNRVEIAATVVLPVVLGTLFFVPLPGPGGVGKSGELKPHRLYVWSCGGLDAHEVPARVVELPAVSREARAD